MARQASPPSTWKSSLYGRSRRAATRRQACQVTPGLVPRFLAGMRSGDQHGFPRGRFRADPLSDLCRGQANNDPHNGAAV